MNKHLIASYDKNVNNIQKYFNRKEIFLKKVLFGLAPEGCVEVRWGWGGGGHFRQSCCVN